MAFENKTALVTGATGNIGSELCRRFVAEGVKVAITDLDAKKCKALADELSPDGSMAFPFALDVTSSENCISAVKAVGEKLGKIDILVNNAGVWARKKQMALFELDEEFWTRSVNINLHGTYRMIREVLPLMLKNRYGRIINIASIAGEAGLPGYSDYAASKAGVIILTKTLAMEVAKENITVNSVSPGMVSAIPGKTPPTEGTWIGRSCERGEVVDAILFLAKDESSFITGVDLPVEGGRILGPHNASFTVDRSLLK